VLRIDLNDIKEEQQHAIKANETKTPKALYPSVSVKSSSGLRRACWYETILPYSSG